MRIISPQEKVSQISCDCGTDFEYDIQDIGMKGDYTYHFFVECPSCKHSHGLELTSQQEEQVKDYISGCKSCRSCKYFSIVKEGYSSYTVTNIAISCKMSANPRFPLSGYETGNEKEYAYAFAEQCRDHKDGVNYEKDVEESQEEAFQRWERKNNNRDRDYY